MSVPIIKAAVEGLIDEAVVRRLIAHVGGVVGEVHGRDGKAHLHQRLQGYNRAALHESWIVLVDLDADADCAPMLRDAWLPRAAPRLCFRIVVREIEAWLMADAATLADYLSVARSRIPMNVEGLGSPKTTLVNLARGSRRRNIRTDMVPHEGSGRQVGSVYVSRLIEYVQTTWRPEVASRRSESLHRAIVCLRRLVVHRDPPEEP